MSCIRYRKGYKYQLTEDYVTHTRITPLNPIAAIRLAFITLDPNGTLTGHAGYAWDGPSGPAIDTKNFMRPSCGHDIKYQLIRLGLVAKSSKKIADDEMRQECLEDGMSKPRAWWCWAAVSKFGIKSTRPSAEPQILAAP
jgi:hypothetical protein